MKSLSVYKRVKSYPTKPILTDEECKTPMLLCRVPSIPKQYSRERLNQLATPKKDHLDELSRPLENVKWGNQEPLKKIRYSNSLPSARLIKLAQPKKNFARPELQPIPQYRFSCGRGSEIETTKLQKRNQRAKSPTARLVELAKSIQRPHIGKVDPIRRISEATKHAVPSDRIEELAKPNKISDDFSIDRPLVQRVSKSATQVLCSDRVLELAKPNPKKIRNQPIIKTVTKGALQYQPSDRIKELAKPASGRQNYEIPRHEFWLVKKAAIKGQTPPVSPHLTIKAKRESMELAQFDPNAFIVSEAAKKAKCSRRIEELAQPIQR